ncbi:MAG: PEPxxWA-CTERM sorting domain-containing protein [Phenylobacterium sp.]
MTSRRFAAFLSAAALTFAGAAQAGPVFLTGHDPDYHAQGQASGVDELKAALNYVTGGTYAGGAEKFLYVESNLAVLGGHVRGMNSLTGSLGLVQGVNFDQVNAVGLQTVNFSNYSAIVVASDFGAMLSDAEIEELIARKSAIQSFVNNGGGLAAFAECGYGFSNCDPTLVTPSTPLFGFVPVNASSVSTTPPYILTPFGVSLGLSPGDVDDCCTHNSFANTAGLQVVDYDQTGIPTTLAGNVRITDNGFTPPGVPEPAAWALMIAGFAATGAMLRRRRALQARA